MEEIQKNSFLETEKIGKLMRKYAIPCIISLVTARSEERRVGKEC